MSACVLYQKTSRWDGELTRPIDWGVEEYEHLELGDRVFLSRTGQGGGVFATGTIVEPPPDCHIIHQPVVFESPNPEGKMTPHINVLVDIPSPPKVPANPPQCSRDYPVLIGKLKFPEYAKRDEPIPNGAEIPREDSAEDLREKLRKAWEGRKD